MSDSQNRVAVSEPSLDNKIKNWSDWQCLSPIIKARVTRQLRQQLNDRVFSELSNRFFDIEGESAGYDSGYNVGHADGYESGHEAGSADGYDRSYDFGYSAGEPDASRSSTYPSGSTNTGIGSTRDAAIADGYIGNLNSHKFHYSWCSYLPDQENQIVFSSRDAAVSAGYNPCGRCHP